MKPVVVVIPVYQEKLRLSERVSLRQAQQVLGKYDICFMAPERMRPFLSVKGVWAEYWSDNCFESVRAYSHLLLTEEFYSRFAEYEYMLLYQLDAFVFSDRLHYFCSLGYDFIGAPMPHSRTYRTHVGINGGLALRKIDSCIHVTQMMQKMQLDDEMRHMFNRAEDKFFSYCGGKEDIAFSVPKVAISSDFAIEFNVAHCWDRLSSQHLPFGCHAWSKSVYFNLWRPYIEPFVGKEMMDKVAEEVFANGTVNYYKDWIFSSIARYLIKRMMREKQYAKVQRILQKRINPASKPIILWGYGDYGQRCLDLFLFANLPVSYIFDKNVTKESLAHEIPLAPPNYELIKSKNNIVVISTKNYYHEIANDLIKIGLNAEEDFFAYQDIERYLVQNYYVSLWEEYLTSNC